MKKIKIMVLVGFERSLYMLRVIEKFECKQKKRNIQCKKFTKTAKRQKMSFELAQWFYRRIDRSLPA